ncbi:MAG: N-acetyl sugar amidotransferase [Bacteroidota bacterium]
MRAEEIQVCTTCVLDTTVEDIWFDEQGECKYCKIHNELEKKHPLGKEGQKNLEAVVQKIKDAGKGKDYDCIVGVSGGRDSTYTLLTAIKLGLRPLAVHFDNGWNTDISVSNIKNSISKFDVTLHTVVADWEEFKDLQRSFLQASVPDADIPTDFAIYSVLYKTAAEEGIKYILNGHSFRTEGTSPISWTYMDSKYFRAVHRMFGKKKIKSFPVMSFFNLLNYIFFKRIKEVRLMEFIDYNKKAVDQILKDEVNWEYYGGHHHENTFTKFFQSYYLPKKFNIDKRKTELSALVRSGQITRDEALKEINGAPYEYEEKVVNYTASKLDFSNEEFDKIMKAPNKSHNDYPTLLPLIRLLKLPIKIAGKLKLVPSILYLKYAK